MCLLSIVHVISTILEYINLDQRLCQLSFKKLQFGEVPCPVSKFKFRFPKLFMNYTNSIITLIIFIYSNIIMFDSTFSILLIHMNSVHWTIYIRIKYYTCPFQMLLTFFLPKAGIVWLDRPSGTKKLQSILHSYK